MRVDTEGGRYVGGTDEMKDMDKLFLVWLGFKLVVDGFGFLYILVRLHRGG